jgi:tetratricopeptide (TPR) repeat protein
MHELIRQFAKEQLQVNSEEYKQALDRHYVYYTCFLQQRTGALKGGRQRETLADISAEIDNVRAAWQRAVELKDSAALEPAAECLCLYSEMRGALDEGEAAFSQAAAAFAPTNQIDSRITEEQTSLRGFLLVGQGMLRAHRGDLKGGQALLEQGLSLFRQSNDHKRYLPQKAFALMWLGWTLFLQAKNSEAEQITQESLNLFSEIGDRWGVAKSLFVLGNSLTGRGQLNEAEPPLRESLTIFQEIDDRRNCLLVNRNIAILTFWFGDYAQTGQLLDQAAMLSREFDDQIGLAYALRELGKLEAAEGKYAQAIQTLQKSIAITDEIGSHWESAVSHDDLGVALRQTGDYVAAEWALNRCLEASQALDHRYFTARCLGNLGCVAYHRGEYQQAEQRLQQALELWAQIGHEPYSAWVLCQLGYVMAAVDSDRKAEARQYFSQALQLSVRHRLAPFALDAFVGIAGLLACTGEKQYATHLLALAEQDAASAYETTEKARSLRNELKTDTADDVLTPGRAPDQTLDWQAMAEQTIEVLSTLPG